MICRSSSNGGLRAIGGMTSVATAATFPFGVNRDGVLYLGIQGTLLDPDHPLVARAHRATRSRRSRRRPLK
jgi:hypothetical protein